MKQQLNKKLKILFLFTVVFFSSCEKDLYEEPIYRERNSKAIQLKDFMRETGIKDFSSVIKVPLSRRNTLSRTATLSDFNIDIDVILKHINESNKVTYSFKINPTSFESQENEKFNLVYMKEGNVWQQSILSFKEANNTIHTQNKYEDFEKLYDSRLSNLETQSLITELCFSESYIVHCTDSGPCSVAEGKCDGCYLCVTRFITVQFCITSGGSSNTGNDSDNNNVGASGNSSQYDPYDFTPNDGSTPFQETPCNKVFKLFQSNEVDLKPSVDWLKTKIQLQLDINGKEFGVQVKKNMNPTDEGYNYTKVQKYSPDNFQVVLLVGGNHFGSLHAHPLNGVGIPSFGDLKWLLDCYDSANSDFRKNYVFSVVVAKDKSGNINVYTLKINDVEGLRNSINAVLNDPIYASFTDEKQKLEKIHKNEGKYYFSSGNDLEKSFLQKYGTFGIDLYKAANENLDQWNKLELGTNPDTTSPEQLIVTQNPC